MRLYRLSSAAQTDLAALLAHTDEWFGETARRRYQALLVVSLLDLAANPQRPGSVARPEFGQGVRSYHLRHSRERARTADGRVGRPRHLLLYRALRPDLIGIGRVLHDSMEVETHLPSQYGDE